MTHATDNATQREGRLVDLDERRWLARHCRGDRSAFMELIQAYRSPVYGYLVRCGIESAARDDLFQEIFLRVHKAAAHYQSSRPLRPWLFTIAANTVRNHLRKQRVRELALDEGAQERLPSTEPEPDKVVQDRQTLCRLEDALTKLPLAQREVVLLSCVEGLEQKDVAAALQLPINTVKTHLRRARLALARELALRGAGGTP